MTVSLLKNIELLPVSIQSVVTNFARQLLANLNGHVHAILVYGAAVRVEDNPRHIDIHTVVIVPTLDFSVLKNNLSCVRQARKHRIAVPLFLTKAYILNTLDVFPIEFSAIKERHLVIFGEDVFKNLIVPRQDIRLLCEQQIKGKLLHLRQAYLSIGLNGSLLKKFILGVFNDLIPVLRQLIILKGQNPQESNEQMLKQCACLFSLDPAFFLDMYQDTTRPFFVPWTQAEGHLQHFLNALEILSSHLDAL